MLPPLVRRALELERAQGLAPSCGSEVGRLLHVLAASRGRSRVAEIGTGAGVGSAWLVSALAPHVPFFTTESDPARAAAAGELFRDDENVHVLAGDWHATLPPEAPFDLLAVSAAEHLQPEEDRARTIGLLAPGGLAVLGGLTTAVRAVWLGHPELAATEVAVGATHVVLAVRR